MTTKLYDLAVAASKFTTRDGKEKTRWETVGSLIQGQDNQGNDFKYIMLKRSFNPAGVPCKDGADSIRISLFKPKNSQQQPAPQSASDNTFNNGQQFSAIGDDYPPF